MAKVKAAGGVALWEQSWDSRPVAGASLARGKPGLKEARRTHSVRYGLVFAELEGRGHRMRNPRAAAPGNERRVGG